MKTFEKNYSLYSDNKTMFFGYTVCI